MRLYHFTAAHHLDSILADGELRTTDPNLFTDGPVLLIDRETGDVRTVGGPIHGQPVVWLLDTPEPEHDHGLSGSILDKRAVRITVDVPDAVPWLRWLSSRRYDERHVRAIIRSEWIEVRGLTV